MTRSNSQEKPKESKEALVERIRSGDNGAVADLFVRCTAMIRSIASGYHADGMEPDDLIQEGFVGLFFAVQTFDAKKGVNFETYAATCIANRIRTVARASGAGKHQILSNAVSIEDVQLTEPGTPEELLLEQEALRRLYEAVRKNHSEQERNVLALYVLGYDAAAIAQQLKVDKKAVYNAMSRIRRKWKNWITLD